MVRRSLLRVRTGALLGTVSVAAVLLVTAVAAVLAGATSLTLAVIGGGPGPSIATATAVEWVVPVVASALAFVGLDAVVYALRSGASGHSAPRDRSSSALELTARARRIAQRANVPDPEVRVLDSPVPNSFTTGPSPTIYVTSALRERLSDGELDAVLAHELAHVGNGDPGLLAATGGVAHVAGEWIRTAARCCVAALAMLVALFALAVPVAWLGATPLIERLPGVAAALVVHRTLLVVALGTALASAGIGLALVPAYLLCLGLARRFARTRELAADAAAATITGSPGELASALERLSTTERKPGRDARASGGPIRACSLVSGPVVGSTGPVAGTRDGEDPDPTSGSAVPGVTDLALANAHPPVDERIRRLRGTNPARRFGR